mmetsp:Transcript_48259/g.140689  ORF Transcript_48259/g.140689 Transcript_48259/m.140689 type:complete len:251 (+) Transcript_48259:61-813(+)
MPYSTKPWSLTDWDVAVRETSVDVIVGDAPLDQIQLHDIELPEDLPGDMSAVRIEASAGQEYKVKVRSKTRVAVNVKLDGQNLLYGRHYYRWISRLSSLLARTMRQTSAAPSRASRRTKNAPRRLSRPERHAWSSTKCRVWKAATGTTAMAGGSLPSRFSSCSRSMFEAARGRGASSNIRRAIWPWCERASATCGPFLARGTSLRRPSGRATTTRNGGVADSSALSRCSMRGGGTQATRASKMSFPGSFC